MIDQSSVELQMRERKLVVISLKAVLQLKCAVEVKSLSPFDEGGAI